jgi:two-component system, chemotaxis family, chemotaxis protein CheY
MNAMQQTVIAIIDDDAIFQLTASRMMQATKMADQILQFYNGEEGLRYLNENAEKKEKLPDIIFLDINMPLVDGWMFLDDYANLKNKIGKDILIYMVSSSIDPADSNRAKSNQSVKDYLVKPITMKGFETLLSQFSNRSKN